ncbi:molybdopterin-guanine dinucleotide biosynthesis protein B [Bacillus niameyensis]|uniref:molybdopterin-guanine dinucleotide biosynthesis protein B n=1 Tax=Bacillus niameyensis TaxID=1522308 RepID=UPI000780C653|nr:molybdopterin-guanine dinucleotide biosynthesis protein B [Bacillus niameyensis]
MDGIKVFQVVGYQNSGKTTLMEKLIAYGTSKSFRIGTIKHHGHGGAPDKNRVAKDSDRHREAGAKFACVEGGGILHLEAQQGSWSLDEIISLYKQFELDLVLVEGYKQAQYPKIIMIREPEDLELVRELTNIHSIISWFPIEQPDNYQTFSIDELDRFVEEFFT